jgi:hypothetical protein
VALAYCAVTGYAMTTLSLRAYGRYDFLDDFFANRRSITIDRLEELLEWFCDNWPAGSDMPAVPYVAQQEIKHGKSNVTKAKRKKERRRGKEEASRANGVA